MKTLLALTAAAALTITVNPAGTANPDGNATVSGTVTCPAGNTFYGYADVWQPAAVPGATHRRGLFGDSAHQIPCTGLPQPWTVTTVSGRGLFVPGPAQVYATFATQGPAGLNTVQTPAVPVVLA